MAESGGRPGSVVAMDDATDLPATAAPRGASHLALGARGEVLAAQHLEALGWRVLARNWRISQGELRGELDLLCLERDVLVVVEVKTRSTDRFGAPAEAVGWRKQAQIRRLAGAFLREAGLRVGHVRFDVVGVLVDDRGVRINHVREAF